MSSSAPLFAASSTRLLGFGCQFLDFDSDGWEDLFTANGHVDDYIARRSPGVTYAEPKSLYRNLGNGRFADVSATAGPDFMRPAVGRGASPP